MPLQLLCASRVTLRSLGCEQTDFIAPQLKGNWREEHGQGLAEYLIVVVLIAIIVIIGIRYFGGSVSNQIQGATEQVEGLDEGAGTGAPIVEGEGPKTPSTKRAYERKDTEVVLKESGDIERGGGADKERKAEKDEKDGGGTDLSKRISNLKAEGVGGKDTKPIEEIELDWGTLGFVAAIVCVLAAAFIFRKSGNGKGKKGKKGKKGEKKK